MLLLGGAPVARCRALTSLRAAHPDSEGCSLRRLE